jgi:uncharacterized membrane protein (UPF0127 family)
MIGAVPRLRIAALALALISVAAACSHQHPDFDAARVTVGGRHGAVIVRAALAGDEASRERGLMGVASLPPDAGMAFLFARPTTRGFWMKDTSIPLAVAFWDATGRIVAILDMVPCRRDPCPIYRPGRPYVGALEVARGFFHAHGVAVGSTARIGLPA